MRSDLVMQNQSKSELLSALSRKTLYENPVAFIRDQKNYHLVASANNKPYIFTGGRSNFNDSLREGFERSRKLSRPSLCKLSCDWRLVF